VDDVLIDAPEIITQDMISSLRISTVVIRTKGNNSTDIPDVSEVPESYNLPLKQNILRTVQVSYDITVYDFVERIQTQQERFRTRFQKKMALEEEFYRHKYNL
jgi:hypothetical protein